MSIVKDFSTQFKTIRTLLSPLGVNEVALNKKEASSNYYGRTGYVENKGVDSDHIKIYKTSDTLSFALAFNYEGLEFPVIMATTKDNEEISSSKYNREQFKKKLQNFIELLTVLKATNALNKESAYHTFKTNFLKDNKYDAKQEAELVIGKVFGKVAEVDKKYKKQIDEKNAFKKEVEESKQKVSDVVEAKKKELNVEKLKKQFHDAMDKIYALEEKESKKHKIKEKEDALRKMEWSLYSYEKDVKKVVDEATVGLPREARKFVEDTIMSERKARK